MNIAHIVHRDTVTLGTAHYELTVAKIHGGLIGEWICWSCKTRAMVDDPSPSLVTCLGRIRERIDNHHSAHHSNHVPYGEP